METLQNLVWHGGGVQASEAFECPHCNRQQVISPVVALLNACSIQVAQCLECRELQITVTESLDDGYGSWREPKVLHPQASERPAVPFRHVPNEIHAAYLEACHLIGIHTGSAGAYSRRALELLLDGMGYRAKVILQSIELAKKETDPDKRLPRALLQRLDFIKEIGNFALHVRRDASLVIVDIDPAEVEACLQAIEALLTYVFEDPADAQAETTALNLKLSAANKPLISIPDAPGALWDKEAALAPVTDEA